MKQLKDSINSSSGAAIEFCLYFSTQTLTTSELLAKYAAGEEPINPAVGRIVGCISPASIGELNSIPVGRRLGRACNDWSPSAIGPAFVDVDAPRRTVRVNLITAIPELDATLAKVDLGTLTLQVRHDGIVTVIGEVAYDKANYEYSAGNTVLSYPSTADDAIAKGLFEIVSSVTNSPLLQEVEWAFETDDRNSYTEPGATGEIRLRVLYRGEPHAGRLSLQVAEYISLNQPASDGDRIVSFPDGTEFESIDGEAKIRFVFNQPGNRLLVFSQSAVPIVPVSDLASFANIRALPLDDYSGLPDADVTYAKVYDEVLRYYHLIHPAMSAVFQ